MTIEIVYRELVQRFPQLGEDAIAAAKDEFANLTAELVSDLDLTRDYWPDDVLEPLASWAKNNRELLVFLLKDASEGRCAAQEVIESRRRQRLTELGLSQGVQEAAEVFRAGIEATAQRVMSAMGSAPIIPKIPLYRGIAARRCEFTSTYVPDSLVDWAAPLACTIEPRFTPLHFAWKGRARQIEKGVAIDDVVAAVIEIDPPESAPLKGFWMARFEGKTVSTSYSWQAEVVVPPLRLHVIAIDDLRPDWPGQLMRVKARIA